MHALGAPQARREDCLQRGRGYGGDLRTQPSAGALPRHSGCAVEHPFGFRARPLAGVTNARKSLLIRWMEFSICAFCPLCDILEQQQTIALLGSITGAPGGIPLASVLMAPAIHGPTSESLSWSFFCYERGDRGTSGGERDGTGN